MSEASRCRTGTGAEAIRKYVDWINELPGREDGPWRMSDGDVPGSLPVKLLRDRDVIEVLTPPNRPANEEAEWQVTSFAAEVADRAERYTPCPCGHAGLSNKGEHFECGFDYCDMRFTREQLEVGG